MEMHGIEHRTSWLVVRHAHLQVFKAINCRTQGDKSYYDICSNCVETTHSVQIDLFGWPFRILKALLLYSIRITEISIDLMTSENVIYFTASWFIFLHPVFLQLGLHDLSTWMFFEQVPYCVRSFFLNTFRLRQIK